MAKKLKKSRSTKLINITSKIYSKSCKELGYSVEKIQYQLLWPPTDGGITPEQYSEKKEALDEFYCKHLCELDSKLLEDILIAHVKNQLRRAPRTIDIIQKELLERAFNEDTSIDND